MSAVHIELVLSLDADNCLKTVMLFVAQTNDHSKRHREELFQAENDNSNCTQLFFRTGLNKAYSISRLMFLKPIQRLANKKIIILLLLFINVCSNGNCFCNYCNMTMKLFKIIAKGYIVLQSHF